MLIPILEENCLAKNRLNQSVAHGKESTLNRRAVQMLVAEESYFR